MRVRKFMTGPISQSQCGQVWDANLDLSLTSFLSLTKLSGSDDTRFLLIGDVARWLKSTGD